VKNNVSLSKKFSLHGGPKVGIQYIVNYCIPSFGTPYISGLLLCLYEDMCSRVFEFIAYVFIEYVI